MDKRKLINAQLDDGTIVPLVNAEEMELVESEEGFKIQLKEEKKKPEEHDYGIK